MGGEEAQSVDLAPCGTWAECTSGDCPYPLLLLAWPSSRPSPLFLRHPLVDRQWRVPFDTEEALWRSLAGNDSQLWPRSPRMLFLGVIHCLLSSLASPGKIF